jgi:subtilisin family serine protease
MRVILFLGVVFLLASCIHIGPELSLEAESIVDPRDPLPWNQPGYFNSLETNRDYAPGELIAVYRQQSVFPPNVDVAQGELRTALLNYLRDRLLPDGTIRLVDLDGNGDGDAVYTVRSTTPTVSIGTTPVCGQLIARFVFTGITLKDAIIALNDLTPGGYLPQGNSLYGISPKGLSRLTGKGNLLTPAFTVNQWAYQVANADPNARADKIKVAVLDTGVSNVGKMVFRNRANFVTLVANTNEPTTNTIDNFLPDGHGTGVAALIASEDYGVAPGAYIVPVKVCDGEGVCDDITLSRGICYAQSVGAEVINLSLGTLLNSPMVRQAIREVTSRGSLVVAASGNTNSSQFTGVLQNKPDYPAYWANFDGLLSVGAVDQNTQYGDFATANSRVELVAPGADLQLGNPPADATGIESLSSIAGNRAYFEGTSFAAPFVAGAAANLYAKCSILKRNNINGPRWIENTLKATATPWSPVSQDPARPLTNLNPKGLVNITNALAQLCP